MKVHLLGTGSADGWPNPFCTCASCHSQRVAGRSRSSTAALVDSAILIDCGPTVGHAAALAGVDLRGVQHVLLTHGHPDHLAPAFLLWRQWISGLAPLHLWGPADALALCTHWIAPGAPVHLHPIAPDDVVELEVTAPANNSPVSSMNAAGSRTYRLSVHAAQHAHGDGDVLAEEAVIFGLDAPDGTSLLYATDTGLLDDSTRAGLRDRAFDLALVDATFGTRIDHGTGHLDLATLPRFLDGLREVGALTPSSDIIAVHLSHHNPPAPELAVILAPMGARIVDDLTLVHVPREPLRLRTLVLGGARSGKSHHAEALAKALAETLPEAPGSVTYIATAGSRPDDQEWAERVRLHRQRRPAHWHTLETTDLITALEAIAPGEVALVECIGMWLTAQLDAADGWTQDRQAAAAARDEVTRQVDAFINALDRCQGSVILVSNEVGMDVVPATASGRLFRDLLGAVNARLATRCEDVTLLVAGRALPLPAGPTSNTTPTSITTLNAKG